jgi:adenylate kinase
VIPGARLVLLGRQGAGKGTQCIRLSRHYVVPHISTGDMLRAAVKEGTAFGRKAKEYMDAGELLPDDIMIGIVDERLEKDDTRHRGYILDGFPRTVVQAEALDELVQPEGLDVVIELDVPRDAVMERIADRRVCVDCQTIYSLAASPKYGWVCDNCGGDVVQRADDSVEAITLRLDLYDSQTTPLIDYYGSRGSLQQVHGIGTTDEVTGRLIRAIDSRRQAG